MKNKIITKCIGCGLCESAFDNVNLINHKGFLRPCFTDKQYKKIKSFCPLKMNSEKYSINIWGKYQNVYIGASSDNYIRYKASSGGIITQILIYLLEKGLIDGVIHIGQSKDNPLQNSVYLSTSSNSILNNSGSRYSPAAPLTQINSYLEMNKKFAFVGKPCDVRALLNYKRVNKNISKKILYTFSFFCAGTPSYVATEMLIEQLGIKKDEVKEFWYRGNGWPGLATAVTKDGRSACMTYNDSWGAILSKDVQTYCRWCADGVGEFADVSCCDAWTLDKNNKPDFHEKEGLSIIWARSKEGDELLHKVMNDGYICINDYKNNIEELKYTQHFQYIRKTTMLGKILALKLMLKSTPNYNLKLLIAWGRNVSIIENIRKFIGTFIRGIYGKL